MLFLDSGALPDDLARAYSKQPWHVTVAASSDSTLQGATVSAKRTFMMVVIAAAISLLSLLLAIRSARASAAIASMKSEFVSAVTHELKTPLQSIRLVGDTLIAKRYSSPEKVRQYAVMLSEEATRLTHSIDNLLAFARYASKPAGDPGGLATLDVHDTIEAALEPFRPTLEQQGFRICVSAPPDLPRVSADRSALVKMMQNIIDNAIKYSAIVKSLEIRAYEEGDRVEIAFADQGIGVPAPDLPHVFDKFYRGRNTNVTGSGLGLAIAKRIAEFHRGDISLASVVAQGTTVTVVLPAERTHE
jgi:signal transduction histidine kinase